MTAVTRELNREGLEQVIEQLRDPGFDAAAAGLLGQAYDAYLMFARQAPNLLLLSESADEK